MSALQLQVRGGECGRLAFIVALTPGASYALRSSPNRTARRSFLSTPVHGPNSRGEFVREKTERAPRTCLGFGSISSTRRWSQETLEVFSSGPLGSRKGLIIPGRQRREAQSTSFEGRWTSGSGGREERAGLVLPVAHRHRSMMSSAAVGPTPGAVQVDEPSAAYRLPPEEILSIVDAPPNPALSFSPDRSAVLLLRRPSLPPIADLARPELKLAGIRIDPVANTRSRMSSYLGISIAPLLEDDSLGNSEPIEGIPENSRINFLSWSPDARHIAFTVQLDSKNDAVPESRQLSLWVADVASRKARQLIGPPTVAVNTVFDSYSWINESTLVVCAVPEGRPPLAPRALAPSGPKIQDNQSGEVAQSRTFTDLLKDSHDEDLLDYFATSQLLLVSLDGHASPLGAPAMFTSVDPSNDGEYLLVKRMKRPFSLEVPCGRFPTEVEVWRATTGEVRHRIADLPLALSIPITFNSVRSGPRSIFWRSDLPSTLYWVETQDGGDAAVEASPRDIIFTLAADAPPGHPPTPLHGLNLRYGGVVWGDGTFAWVDESWHKTRRTRTWHVPLDGLTTPTPTPSTSSSSSLPSSSVADSASLSSSSSGEEASDEVPAARAENAARIVFDRSYEDRYSDPGSPMLRRTPLGTYVIAQFSVKDSDAVSGEDGRGSIAERNGSEREADGSVEVESPSPSPGGRLRLLLCGDGATPEGNVPFVDLFDPESGKKERLWTSDKETVLENMASLLTDTSKSNGPLSLSQSKFLYTRESKTEPPQYFIKRWKDGSLKQITNFPHPYPTLKNISKEIIRYNRKDGVQLTANLLLPPGYDPVRDGPLPMLMWAYPREYKSKDAAGQVRGSPNQFSSIGGTSPLLWLARGYAVLSGPSMPIIGEGDEEANDRFVEQLVTSAEAAVEEVTRRGVAERGRIAIGGHSYGAFMSANLIARAPDLFCCAIAQSGAYNRTLTPFGFQSEERTLWQVPDVYMAMSPFALADKIKTPTLLIHGEEDNNTGTFPLQSERFYAALKGHGAPCRLVVLPHEGHGYRSRESILHVLAETSDWLDRYCKGGKAQSPELATTPQLASSL